VTGGRFVLFGGFNGSSLVAPLLWSVLLKLPFLIVSPVTSLALLPPPDSPFPPPHTHHQLPWPRAHSRLFDFTTQQWQSLPQVIRGSGLTLASLAASAGPSTIVGSSKLAFIGGLYVVDGVSSGFSEVAAFGEVVGDHWQWSAFKVPNLQVFQLPLIFK
jgi:hypothetical protein